MPHRTPSTEQQYLLSEQIFVETPTELRSKQTLSMKDVKIENLWAFELGSREKSFVPFWIFVGFQERDRQNSRNLNNDTFCRLPFTKSQRISRTKNFLMLA